MTRSSTRSVTTTVTTTTVQESVTQKPSLRYTMQSTETGLVTKDHFHIVIHCDTVELFQISSF